MRRIFKLGLLVSFCIFISGCGWNDFKKQEEKLAPLVQSRASKQEAITLLGPDFIMSSKGQTNWDSLAKFLAGEPPSKLSAVRRGAAKWPHVMQFSTPDMMTWVFLDENEKVVEIAVGAQ